MVLNKSTETGNWKIHPRSSKGLSKLIGIAREKIRDRTEEIHTPEAVRYIGPQSDSINSSASFPKLFALRAGIRVAALIPIFAAFAVPGVGTPECDQPGHVDLRPEWLVSSQNGATRSGLKPQIAYRL